MGKIHLCKWGSIRRIFQWWLYSWVIIKFDWKKLLLFLIHRYGKYWFNAGAFYEGDWDYGVKSGIGELTFSNNDRYIGHFYEDAYDGPGTLHYGNGDVFEGKFIIKFLV